MKYKEPLQHFLDRKGFLTLNQLVKYLDEYHPDKAVSYPTLKRWLEKGLFTSYKFGSQTRLTKESIDKFCKYGTEGPPEAPQITVETLIDTNVEIIPPEIEVITVDRPQIGGEGAEEPSLASLYGLDEESQQALRQKLNAHDQASEEDPTDDKPKRGRPKKSTSSP